MSSTKKAKTGLGSNPLEKKPLSWLDQGGESKPSKQSNSSKPSKPSGSGKRKLTNTSQEGLPENWTRATFIVREDLLDKVKDLAYWDRRQVKEIVNESLEAYINKHEKKSGTIKPRKR
jgi:hypothetical protein